MIGTKPNLQLGKTFIEDAAIKAVLKNQQGKTLKKSESKLSTNTQLFKTDSAKLLTTSVKFPPKDPQAYRRLKAMRSTGNLESEKV